VTIMTREMYMQELDRLLSAVPQPVRTEWLFDYDMHFRMAAERGMTEEQAAMELGDPRAIAGELLLNYRVHQAEDRSNVVSVSRAVFATVGLGFFNLIFVLGPFVALMAGLLALWGVSVAFFGAAVAAVVEAYRGTMFSLQQGLFVALAATGLGLLSGAGTLYLTRGFFKLTLNYLKFNTRLVRGGKEG